MYTIAFASLGCKLNKYEIQLISEALRKYGFETVPFKSAADCYVINTCGVTGNAELSSRQLIRRARKSSPDAKIIATGCYTSLAPENFINNGIDAVVSNMDKNKIPATVLNLFGLILQDSPDKPCIDDSDSIISGMNDITRAYTKIQDGCDDKCTFCAIWMARGPVRSRPLDTIVREINKLAENGYKEAVLTGVHIGKYSFYGLRFNDLLREILVKTSIQRIRLSSLNPIEIDDDLIDLIASSSRICPHLHLSIQSGDNDILHAMGRKYTADNVKSVIEKSVARINYLTIGADIIVGFPGEDDQKFQNTHELLNQSDIHHLHVFPYSDRNGTAAAAMRDKVKPEIKTKRAAILKSVASQKKNAHLQNYLGKKLKALIEKRPADDGMLTGLTENYLRIKASGDNSFKGNIVTVLPYAIDKSILLSKIDIETDSQKNKLTYFERAGIIDTQ